MKQLKILTLLLFSTFLFAQQKNKNIASQEIKKPTEFIFSENGLTDFVVINCPNKKQYELYKKTLDWVEVNYNDSKEVIKGKIENDYIRLEGYTQNMLHVSTESESVPVQAKYQIEISFKDGRYKFDIISVDYKLATWIEINLNKSNTSFEKNTDPIQKVNKSFPIDISTYFNNLNKNLKDFIQNKQIPSKKSDW